MTTELRPMHEEEGLVPTFDVATAVAGATAAGAAPPSSAGSSVGFSDDPGLVMTSCANCGAQMLDRKCKLICSCGYFLSCSDYY